jgi:small multidrug resistance pump
MGWIYLLIAILLEFAGTFSLKYSEGFTHLLPVFYALCFYLGCLLSFTLALNHLELSRMYALWTGIGTILSVFVGYYFFKEPLGALKCFSIFLIVLGVLGTITF